MAVKRKAQPAPPQPPPQSSSSAAVTDGTETVKDASEFPYLMDAIVEMSKSNEGLSLLYKNGFELMGETKTREFEAKFKKLKYHNAKMVADNTELEYKLCKDLVKAGK